MNNPIILLWILVTAYTVYGIATTKRDRFKLSEVLAILLLTFLLCAEVRVAIYDIRGIDLCELSKGDNHDS